MFPEYVHNHGQNADFFLQETFCVYLSMCLTALLSRGLSGSNFFLLSPMTLQYCYLSFDNFGVYELMENLHFLVSY